MKRLVCWLFGHVRPASHWSHWAVWHTHLGLGLCARCQRWQTFYVPAKEIEEIQASVRREQSARR